MTLSTVCVTVTRTQCVAGMNEIRGSVCVCVLLHNQGAILTSRSCAVRVPVTHRAAVGTGASSPRPPGCLLRLLRSALRSSSRRSARGSPRRNICLCVMTPCLLHAATVRVSARSGSVEPARRCWVERRGRSSLSQTN